MEENKTAKYYTRSTGEKVDISTMNTEHLINSLGKKYREIFNSKNKNEYEKAMNQINDLKESLYGRFNSFRDGLGDE